MRTYFFRNPALFSWIFPKAIWNYPSKEKRIYLTFDDGPNAEATSYVLDQLKEYRAEATFFCIGENLEKNQHLIDRILNENHRIGNHTYDHINGWRTDGEIFLASVEKTQKTLHKVGVENRLFRPPYGNLTFKSYRALLKQRFQIVFWSHLAGDFDKNVSLGKSLSALKRAKPGSILLFHDSQKSLKNLRYLLPEILAHFTSLGFSFKKIPIH